MVRGRLQPENGNLVLLPGLTVPFVLEVMLLLMLQKSWPGEVC